MDDKKRDLIPVAAIALFLVIIIALCAVRLHQRRETRAEIAETESTISRTDAGKHFSYKKRS